MTYLFMLAKAKTQYRCTTCDYISSAHLGKCPECGSWGTLKEESNGGSASQSGQKSTNKQAHYDNILMSAAAVSTPITPAIFNGEFTAEELAEGGGYDALAMLNIEGLQAGASVGVTLNEIDLEQTVRFSSGLTELDRVLGGGFLAGAYCLVGGDPGIGKSTLMLQSAQFVASQLQKKVLYISGEESLSQIRHRAERLACFDATETETQPLKILAETKLPQVIQAIVSYRPEFIVVDSVQALYDPAQNGPPGSTGQVKLCANAFMQVAKTLNITTILIGHVTKDGNLGGPKMLEHLVDTVLYFEGEKYQDLRLLRSHKNRFGSTQELGVFEMAEQGLKDVANPSQLFLGVLGSQQPIPGCVTVCTLEGSRPLLVELQALAGQSTYASPRRVVNGVETNRLHQIVAVLERRVGLSFANLDLYINVVGGLKIEEPAADLCIALALVTSLRNLSLKPKTVVMGEIGLTGEIRPVRRWRERVMECAKIGFRRIVLPSPAIRHNEGEEKTTDADVKDLLPDLPEGVEVFFIQHVRDAIVHALEPSD